MASGAVRVRARIVDWGPSLQSAPAASLECPRQRKTGWKPRVVWIQDRQQVLFTIRVEVKGQVSSNEDVRLHRFTPSVQ